MQLIPIILYGGAGTRLRLKGLDIGVPIISYGESHRFMVTQQI